MMRFGRGWAIALAAAGWLAASPGCLGSPYQSSYDDGTIGDLGRGFFFVWETFLPHDQDCDGWYGCAGPIDDQRIKPLAAGATVHVGFSAGGCVRAEDPAVASSPDCGVVRGVASGTSRLVVTDGGEILDHTALHVDEPTGIDVRTPWGDLLETLVSIGFDETLDTVVVLTAGQDLMGVGGFTLASEPPDCVHADGYGRYFRLTALCTGRITVTYRAIGLDASDVLRLEVREPTTPRDGGWTGYEAGGAEADAEAEDGDPADAPFDDDAGTDGAEEDVEERDAAGETAVDDDADAATSDEAVDEADAGGVD